MEIKYGRKLLQYCRFFKIQIQDSNWDSYNGESLTSHIRLRDRESPNFLLAQLTMIKTFNFINLKKNHMLAKMLCQYRGNSIFKVFLS